MLSRAADAAYWMCRYVERAESTASLLDVNLQLVLDLPSGLTEDWAPLLWTLGSEPLYREHFGEPRREAALSFLLFDAENLSSILSCLHAARENARSIREHISPEMWEGLNRAYLGVRAASALELTAPHELFAGIRTLSHLFAGDMDAMMSHGEGWHFGRIGRFLERADQTSRILGFPPPASEVGAAVPAAHWTAVLAAAGAFEMYRRRHGTILPDRVADFLILDRELPRSIRHAVGEAEASLRALAGSPANEAERRLGQLRSDLDDAKIGDILTGGLDAFLHGVRERLNGVGDALAVGFFALPPAAVAAGERSA